MINLLMGMRLVMLLSAARHRETYILREGVDKFFEKYDFTRKDHPSQLYKFIIKPDGIPNEIIPGHLWIGNGYHVKKFSSKNKIFS